MFTCQEKIIVFNKNDPVEIEFIKCSKVYIRLILNTVLFSE